MLPEIDGLQVLQRVRADGAETPVLFLTAKDSSTIASRVSPLAATTTSTSRSVFDLPEEPVDAVGDGQRLHQVVADLLANAHVHTDPGTTVEVALAAESDRAVITITDNGSGIPPDLRSTLFERFARGDSSRFRGAGSTGLGLAIVQAMMVAHRGDVTVHSEPDRTQFRVTLPLAP